MTEGSLPPIQAYHPMTFQERGVLIPFTTPLLGGTRARPGEKSGLELVIPNPSGGSGVYIMGWSAITALCRPTLHDRQLSERVAAISHILPSTIKRVAREVATEGLAGEEAAKAALTAENADQHDRTATNLLLLSRSSRRGTRLSVVWPSTPIGAKTSPSASSAVATQSAARPIPGAI